MESNTPSSYSYSHGHGHAHARSHGHGQGGHVDSKPNIHPHPNPTSYPLLQHHYSHPHSNPLHPHHQALNSKRHSFTDEGAGTGPAAASPYHLYGGYGGGGSGYLGGGDEGSRSLNERERNGEGR